MRRSAAFLILLTLSGCATTGPQPQQRDGQSFGVVDGTFRARWWNYYERGRSYLDGGFTAAARADLETALSLRAEDQRWARTYGLHFIPEYFPNRELGIADFQEGKLDEAQRLLQRSLEQEHSALAAHYLDKVRAAQISKNGGDHEAPSIEVENSTLAQDPATGMQGTLRAHLRDNTYIAQVEINGAPWPLVASAPEVTIAKTLPLFAGANTFHLKVVDLAGNVTEKSVQLVRDFDGPAISFDHVGPDGVSGTLADPSGVAELQLADRAVDLTPDAAGNAHFSAPATSGALAFVATDRLGNETRGSIGGAAPGKAARALNGLRLAANVDNAWLATALADAANAEATGLRLANLANGQRYLMDEIVVNIEASDPAGVTAIELDGTPLNGLVAGAKSQYLSRRLRLDAMGPHTVHAKMTNTSGQVRDVEVNIERAPTDVERPEERLRVALIGNLWEGAGPTLENEANFVAEELSGALFKRGRMDVISRDALPRVLQEQELRTVLGSRDLDAGLRHIVPADVLAVGKVRRTGDTLEIILQAVSSETSNILAYADVAGPAKSLDDLRALTRDLAIRFEQEFPRVSGTVVQVPSPERCFSTLAEADRVRPELPCLVYRLGAPIVHPETGAVLGRPTEIIARGSLTEVQRQMSRIQLQSAGNVQVNDHVATR